MAESVCEHLHRLAEPIWRAQRTHPFVRGIGDGTLDPSKFSLWLRQDYLFLIDYGRMFAYAAARAPDLTTMQAFARLLTETSTRSWIYTGRMSRASVLPFEIWRTNAKPR